MVQFERFVSSVQMQLSLFFSSVKLSVSFCLCRRGLPSLIRSILALLFVQTYLVLSSEALPCFLYFHRLTGSPCVVLFHYHCCRINRLTQYTVYAQRNDVSPQHEHERLMPELDFNSLAMATTSNIFLSFFLFYFFVLTFLTEFAACFLKAEHFLSKLLIFPTLLVF